MGEEETCVSGSAAMLGYDMKRATCPGQYDSTTTNDADAGAASAEVDLMMTYDAWAMVFIHAILLVPPVTTALFTAISGAAVACVAFSRRHAPLRHRGKKHAKEG